MNTLKSDDSLLRPVQIYKVNQSLYNSNSSLNSLEAYSKPLLWILVTFSSVFCWAVKYIIQSDTSITFT